MADDKYTGYEKGLTPEEMVANLLETGTPFNYGTNDEWDGLPEVGLANNPDKNQIFTEKDRLFEEE